MSYAAVGSFGAVVPGLECPCPACAAPKMADCTGNERAANCDSVCCPVATFNNGTYGSVIGAQSLQYWNENRVRHALSWLLTINPKSESAENPVDEFAYASAASAAELLSRIRQAAARFNSLFPSNRWRKVINCVSGDCREEGNGYSCYRHSIDMYPGLPPEWVQSAFNVISSVPGGQPDLGPRSMSTDSDWQYAADVAATRSRASAGGIRGGGVFLLSSEGGQVVAIDWLKQFLDVFVPPKLSISKAAADARRKQAPPPPPQVFKLLKSSTMLIRDPTTKSGILTGDTRDDIDAERVNPLIIAGGALVAGGAAFMIMRRLAK